MTLSGFELPVRVFPLGKLGGERTLLVEIEAAQDTGLNFAVAQPAFGTRVDAVGRTKQRMTVAAHPATHPSRHSQYPRAIRHVMPHDRARGNEAIAAERDAAR